jgi:hypothetical protein
MSDDLKQNLRGSCFLAFEDGTNDYETAPEAADRIDELEAKLKSALAALGDIGNGEPEWPDDPQKELDWCRNRANEALANNQRRAAMSDDKISALLNDDRYESKDWKQADLVGRIEWLIIMLEAKCEEVDMWVSIANEDLVPKISENSYE